MLGHVRQSRVLRADIDHTIEEIAEHDRINPETGNHRRDRQQDQRYGHHPGRFMQVLAGMVIHARLAMEHQEVQPERIQRRHEHTQQHRPVGNPGARDIGMVHRLDDGVLGKEAGEERRADQRQRTDQHGNPGDRHVLAQPAHVADVLLMVHGDDHGTGTEEQQRLEEGMCHQVEDTGGIGRGTQCHGHVTQL